MTGEKILVVEDERDILELICRQLVREGYRVARAGTLAEGLAAVGSESYDLLLTDNNLPDGLGTDLIQKLRLESCNRNLMAILMTGGLEMEGWDDEMVADALLSKPFALSELKLVVKNRLASGQAPAHL